MPVKVPKDALSRTDPLKLEVFEEHGAKAKLDDAGIDYQHDVALGNPIEIRNLWTNGRLEQGRTEYRKLLRNGRRERIHALVDLCEDRSAAILCLEADPHECHRSVIAEEAAQVRSLSVVHL